MEQGNTMSVGKPSCTSQTPVNKRAICYAGSRQ